MSPKPSTPVFFYPASDTTFRIDVQTRFARVTGAVEDPTILAAVEALLRPRYPLAVIQVRDGALECAMTPALDAFRDGTVLDDELVRRARLGAAVARGQLYDRHQAVAYSMAAGVTGRVEAAGNAVVVAFQGLLLEDDPGMTTRVRVARRARDAAVRSGISAARDPNDPLTALQRAVLELARVHRFLGTDIATVLGLDVRDVARLATEGLRALAASRRMDR